MPKTVRRAVFDSPLERPARAMWRFGVRVAPRLASQEDRRAGAYDRLTLEIARRSLRPDSNCIDAGANAGVILKHLVKQAPRGNHHAFEPIPYLASRLRRRFPMVTTWEMALADYNGTSTFRVVRDSPAVSSLFVREDRECGHEVEEIEVPVRALDDVIPPDVPIDLIKVDVEGAEAALFRGARRILRERAPVVIFECGADRLLEVLQLMRAANLSTSTLRSHLLGRSTSDEELLAVAREDDEYMFVAGPRRPVLAS